MHLRRIAGNCLLGLQIGISMLAIMRWERGVERILTKQGFTTFDTARAPGGPFNSGRLHPPGQPGITSYGDCPAAVGSGEDGRG
jgi:hypothetical protein